MVKKRTFRRYCGTVGQREKCWTVQQKVGRLAIMVFIFICLSVISSVNVEFQRCLIINWLIWHEIELNNNLTFFYVPFFKFESISRKKKQKANLCRM